MLAYWRRPANQILRTVPVGQPDLLQYTSLPKIYDLKTFADFFFADVVSYKVYDLFDMNNLSIQIMILFFHFKISPDYIMICIRHFHLYQHLA